MPVDFQQSSQALQIVTRILPESSEQDRLCGCEGGQLVMLRRKNSMPAYPFHEKLRGEAGL